MPQLCCACVNCDRRVVFTAHIIVNWMASNRLKLNTSKTELVCFASPHRLTKFVKPPINVGQTRICPTTSGHVFSRYDN